MISNNEDVSRQLDSALIEVKVHCFGHDLGQDDVLVQPLNRSPDSLDVAGL